MLAAPAPNGGTDAAHASAMRRALPHLFAVLALVACSSADDPPAPATPQGSDSDPTAPAGNVADAAADQPNDDPGADVDEPEVPLSGGDCVTGGLYCGGDKVTGDPKTLYKCTGPGAPAVVEVCAAGCAVNPGRNDSCAVATSGGNCTPNGLYCGGDKISGDPKTLYKCTGPGAPAVVKVCAAGCRVNPGQNDSCAVAVTTSGGNCALGGHYCGGDKVTGDAKTLYQCNGPGTPTVIKICAAGCQVNPGSDDTCKDPSGRIASPVPGKGVTYPYGVKNSRYAAGYHTGEDYAAATGTNLVAVRSGTIRWSNGNGGAYGNWIGLDADNGRTYVYCHLSSRSVAAGAKVSAGQLLGKVGATGNVTGPHLHFEDHPKGPFVYAQVRKPTW